MTSRIGTVAVLVLDGAALVGLRPRPVQLTHRLAHAGSWISGQPDAALAQLVAAALWLVAAWLGVGLLAGLLAHLPGVLGAVGRRVVTVALPRVLQRLVVGSLGVGIVLTPIAAGATPSAARVPGPVWPTSPAATTPAPRWPVTPPTRPAPAVHPAPGAAGPTSPAPTPTRTRTTRSVSAVQVRAGDTLWQLAADHLGPAPQPQRVSHYWHRIYAANRAVVGGDPDRIHPGQQLVLPAPTAQELP